MINQTNPTTNMHTPEEAQAHYKLPDNIAETSDASLSLLGRQVKKLLKAGYTKENQATFLQAWKVIGQDNTAMDRLTELGYVEQPPDWIEAGNLDARAKSALLRMRCMPKFTRLDSKRDLRSAILRDALDPKTVKMPGYAAKSYEALRLFAAESTLEPDAELANERLKAAAHALAHINHLTRDNPDPAFQQIRFIADKAYREATARIR